MLKTLIIVLFCIVAVLMMLIILIQSSKATGMGLFGSSSADSVLGAGGIDTLQKITAVLAVLFTLGAFGISFMYSKGKTSVDVELQKAIQQQQQQQQQQGQQGQQPGALLPGVQSMSTQK